MLRVNTEHYAPRYKNNGVHSIERITARITSEGDCPRRAFAGQSRVELKCLTSGARDSEQTQKKPVRRTERSPHPDLLEQVPGNGDPGLHL